MLILCVIVYVEDKFLVHSVQLQKNDELHQDDTSQIMISLLHYSQQCSQPPA